jgi:2,3-diketo-5-methylthio-1-phosphopentane phosphatase
VLCDFDGTISVDDVTDALLERHGRAGWRALEDAWTRGEIGSRECMQGQVALLDMSESDLLRQLDAMAIDPDFAAFVQAAAQAGIAVEVVSDGLDRAIRHILGRHGLGHLPVSANRLLQTGPRRWHLDTPHAHPHCERASGNCKCSLAARHRQAGERVLYVGDGSSDFCVSGRVDLVLAKASLLEHCRQRGLPHRAIAGFGEALPVLHELLAVPARLEAAA